MVLIRPATLADAPAIAAIYAPYVIDSVVTFEEHAPDAAEMARRMAAILPDYPYLVADIDGVLVGYAYAAQFHPRPAYRWAVEVTVYLAEAARGRGIGTALYATLIERLAAAGFVTAIGAVTLPNPASVRLHERMGFVACGVDRGVGWKHGAWHDVGYWQRDLAPRRLNPDRPAAPGHG